MVEGTAAKRIGAVAGVAGTGAVAAARIGGVAAAAAIKAALVHLKSCRVVHWALHCFTHCAVGIWRWT